MTFDPVMHESLSLQLQTYVEALALVAHNGAVFTHTMAELARTPCIALLLESFLHILVV